MPKSPEINLLRAKTGRSPELVAITSQLRTIGLGSLMVVLALAVLVGLSFFFASAQLAFLTNQKQQLIGSISGASRKEVLLLVLKRQLGVIGKILANQKQWAGTLDVVSNIALPPTLTSFTVSDKQEMTLVASAGSMDEAVALVGRVVRETEAQHLKNPRLESLELGKDGSVKLIISFLPVL